MNVNLRITEIRRPAWKELPPTIQAEWEKSQSEFYAEGAFSKADLEGLAKYDYEMAETLHPDPGTVADQTIESSTLPFA
jgi:hypothetical protein